MAEIPTPLPFTWQRPNEASAWTCNTVNWAMSCYTDAALPSMDVEVQEVGSEAFVTTQGSPDTRARVQTGRVCAGSQEVTGALRCMVAVGTVFDMKLAAIYGDAYSEEQFEYPIVANVNEQIRPQRVRLGRGAVGNCWSFRVTNPTGEGFTLSQIDISLERAGINRW